MPPWRTQVHLNNTIAEEEDDAALHHRKRQRPRIRRTNDYYAPHRVDSENDHTGHEISSEDERGSSEYNGALRQESPSPRINAEDRLAEAQIQGEEEE
eukprot:7635363-Heterocapsa_arctica.AAC.1